MQSAEGSGRGNGQHLAMEQSLYWKKIVSFSNIFFLTAFWKFLAEERFQQFTQFVEQQIFIVRDLQIKG
ncbi:MAG: hypothetical protein WC602_00730 [archaeon]